MAEQMKYCDVSQHVTCALIARGLPAAAHSFVRRQSTGTLVSLMKTMIVVGAFAVGPLPAYSDDSYPPLDVLLSSTETVIGQPIAYPEGQAKITAAIVTMVPGQKTGWHKHNVPLFAYMLEGELTVDYGENGMKTYREGDSLIEAFQTSHNGENTGAGNARILAVFAGAEGVANTVMDNN